MHLKPTVSGAKLTPIMCGDYHYRLEVERQWLFHGLHWTTAYFVIRTHTTFVPYVFCYELDQCHVINPTLIKELTTIMEGLT